MNSPYLSDCIQIFKNHNYSYQGKFVSSVRDKSIQFTIIEFKEKIFNIWDRFVI